MLRKKSSGNIKKQEQIDPNDPSKYRQECLREINSLPEQLREQLQWMYEYPVINGKVTNAAIEEFLTGVMYLPSAKANGAYVDFNERGATVNFNAVTCGENGLLTYLRNFLYNASAYSDSDKRPIAEFIASRGGQDLNFLTQLLVKHNHFLPPDLKGQASLHQEDHMQNWTIGENGKATFNWESDFLSVTATCAQHKELCTITKDQKSAIEHFSMMNKDGRPGIEKLHEIEKTPVLRLKYEIQLDVIDGKVIPNITNLIIFNFTNGLTLPLPEERLTNKDDAQNKHILACMQSIDKILEEKNYDYNSPEYRALEIVRRILKQSDGGKNIQDVLFAMQYIESIKLNVKIADKSTLFGLGHKKVEKDLRDLFAHDSSFLSHHTSQTGLKHYNPLSSADSIQGLVKYLLRMGEGMCAPIQDDDFKFTIGSIYLSLCRFKARYEPVSVIKCQTKDSGIEGEFVNEWRDRLNGKQRRYSDSSSEENEIDERVKSFLDTGGVYKEEELSVLKIWMKSKPMESVASLLSYMFSHHMFELEKNPPDTFLIMDKYHISQKNWHFDMSGKIKLSLTYDINSVSAVNSLNNDRFNLVRDQATNHLKAGKSTGADSAPIARVKTEITLDVDENFNVIPNVTMLDIESYSVDFKLSAEAMRTYAADNTQQGPTEGNDKPRV